MSTRVELVGMPEPAASNPGCKPRVLAAVMTALPDIVLAEIGILAPEMSNHPKRTERLPEDWIVIVSALMLATAGRFIVIESPWNDTIWPARFCVSGIVIVIVVPEMFDTNPMAPGPATSCPILICVGSATVKKLSPAVPVAVVLKSTEAVEKMTEPA